MVEVVKKSCFFNSDKSTLEKKINDLIYESELLNENDNNFLENIKKRNNSIFGFNP